jgi:hypothetical protein
VMMRRKRRRDGDIGCCMIRWPLPGLGGGETGWHFYRGWRFYVTGRRCMRGMCHDAIRESKKRGSRSTSTHTQRFGLRTREGCNVCIKMQRSVELHSLQFVFRVTIPPVCYVIC